MKFKIDVNVDVIDVGHGFSVFNTTQSVNGLELSLRQGCCPTAELNETTALKNNGNGRVNFVLPDDYDLSVFAQELPVAAFIARDLNQMVERPWSTTVDRDGAVTPYTLNLDNLTMWTHDGRQLPTATPVSLDTARMSTGIADLFKSMARQSGFFSNVSGNCGFINATLTPTQAVWDELLRWGKPGSREFTTAAVRLVVGP